MDFDEIAFTQYTTNPRALPPAELESAAFELSGRHYPFSPIRPKPGTTSANRPHRKI